MALSVYMAEDRTSFESLHLCLEYRRWRDYFVDLENHYLGISASRMSRDLRDKAIRDVRAGRPVVIDGQLFKASDKWPNSYIQHDVETLTFILNEVHNFKEEYPDMFKAVASLWARLLYMQWDLGVEFATDKLETAEGLPCLLRRSKKLESVPQAA